MKIFLKYLKSNIKYILIFLFFCFVFSVVFYLFSLPIKAVAYAAILCLFFLAVYTIFYFIHFYNKHKNLERIKKDISVSIESMPKAQNQIEEDYEQIIKEIYNIKKDAQQIAEIKQSDLSEYFTLWAHQIKTPIAAMSLILQSDENSEQNRELLGELQRIEQYVEMVLGYLRLESESSDYIVKKYDLDYIIKQAVKKFASQFIRKKIKLEYEPVCKKILTDEKWLLFVIEQILSNSIKYTKTGGSVSIYVEEPFTLCIQDNGIGIASEDLPRIFDKGYTGYNGRADKKSSGIGLYLCKRIAERLGHKIYAISEIGKGTTVKIDFNRKEIEMND